MDILGTLRNGLDLMWSLFGTNPGAVLIPVTYIRVNRSAYAPGGRVVNTETLHPIDRVMMSDYDLAMNPRTDILVSDKNLIIRSSDIPFKPNVSDRVREEDGTEWSIVTAGGYEPVYHDLQVRKR